MNYIVSLTTIPTKFATLHLTIDSIITQTLLPTKIIINIPKTYNFRMNECKIPEEQINEFIHKYSEHNVFINFLNEDYGPGTKLLGLLNSDIIEEYNASTTYILLIDDDLIYNPLMIEMFDKLNNTDVCSFFVYNHLDIKIGQGADGFLIKLNTLDNFLAYYNIIKTHDYIGYHDDFYISYYFYLINVSIEYITPPNGLIYDSHPSTFTDALCQLEGKYSRGNLNEQVYLILNDLNSTGHFAPFRIKDA
jgi:hypothetical protein